MHWPRSLTGASRALPSLRRAVLPGALALLVAASAWASPHGAHPRHHPAVEPPVIEVVFVLDTTGSMSHLIEGAKQKIWSIANQMASGTPTPDVRIGLVAYRDRGDAFVTRRHDLTRDIDAVYARLQAFQAGGGGDTPESVNQALHEAVQHMSWTPGQEVYKVIFLVGDAPPHMDYADDVPYTRSVATAARNGIVINTVQCGTLPTTTPVWQQIASAGAGRYVAIRQDGGMIAMETPHDQELARLNRALGETVVAWGAASERAEIEDKKARALSAPAPSAASRLSYLAKTGGKVNSGREDLVDAVRDGRVDAGALDADALPEPLRALAPEERQRFVEEKIAEREALQQEIARVARERDAWVAKEQARRDAAGEGDGFDQQVLGTIRAQAAGKGIAY